MVRSMVSRVVAREAQVRVDADRHRVLGLALDPRNYISNRRCEMQCRQYVVPRSWGSLIRRGLELYSAMTELFSEFVGSRDYLILGDYVIPVYVENVP